MPRSPARQVRSTDDGRTPTNNPRFGNRAYLNMSGREIANTYTRKMVSNTGVSADDVALGDVLEHMDRAAKDPDVEAPTDASALTTIWGYHQAMSAEEALIWYLFAFGGLDHTEIYMAKRGISHSQHAGKTDLRAIHAQLQTAARRLEIDPEQIPMPPELL